MTEKTRSIIKDALIHVIERKAKNKYYNPTTLEEYLAILRRHDWFYYQSDMNLSSVPSDELLKLAVDGPHSWKMAYNSVHAEHFDNETFYPAGGDSKYVTPFPAGEFEVMGMSIDGAHLRRDSAPIWEMQQNLLLDRLHKAGIDPNAFETYRQAGLALDCDDSVQEPDTPLDVLQIIANECDVWIDGDSPLDANALVVALRDLALKTLASRSNKIAHVCKKEETT